MRTTLATKLSLALALFSVLLAGCSGGDDSSKSSDSGGSKSGGAGSGKKLKIAVIPKGSTHSYWKSLHEGADKAAAEFNVDIVFQGPEKEDDKSSQIQTVGTQIQDKVDGIVLAPLDRQALVKPVKEANDAKIPVVVIDSALDGGDFVSYVATDNEKAGGLAGTALAKDLGGKGKVLVLRYQAGSASTEEREKGFLDAAKAGGLTIESEDQHAGATVETAMKAAENLLTRFKSGDGLSVDGIFCPNESSAQGMLQVLENMKLAGKVKFYGFDSNDKLLAGLDSGEVNGLVLQNPRKMGYLAVKAMVDAINKKPVDKRIDTGATLITKANENTPENKELLAPPKN